jgi:hypothetical protein
MASLHEEIVQEMAAEPPEEDEDDPEAAGTAHLLLRHSRTDVFKR